MEGVPTKLASLSVNAICKTVQAARTQPPPPKTPKRPQTKPRGARPRDAPGHVRQQRHRFHSGHGAARCHRLHGGSASGNGSLVCGNGGLAPGSGGLACGNGAGGGPRRPSAVERPLFPAVWPAPWQKHSGLLGLTHVSAGPRLLFVGGHCRRALLTPANAGPPAGHRPHRARARAGAAGRRRRDPPRRRVTAAARARARQPTNQGRARRCRRPARGGGWGAVDQRRLGRFDIPHGLALITNSSYGLLCTRNGLAAEARLSAPHAAQAV
jgi:hypothetical protein